MKKFLILVLIISIFLMAGCLDNYVPVEDYENKISELEEANNTIGIRDDNIADLEEDLDLTKEELEQYRNLIANLNKLLKNVYYGYARNENYESDGFTAFSIIYKEKFYLITAGHCVENEYGRYYNHRFKANFSNEFIYPKLLVYENDFYHNRDYAIFFSNDINSGFTLGEYADKKFILGSIHNDLNVCKDLFTSLRPGESGSPIINIKGQVMGIGYFTPIEVVTEAIDNLE